MLGYLNSFAGMFDGIGWIAIAFATLFVIVSLMLFFSFLKFIPNDHYGIKERKWSFKSNKNVSASFMSLSGEPGFIPEILTGGWHVVWPGFSIHQEKLITVKSIAYLFARAGVPMTNGQALAAWPGNVDPQDARAFLAQGGQQGPQRRILRQGTYRINTALFVIFTHDLTSSIKFGDNSTHEDSMLQTLKERNAFDPVYIQNDKIAIVTVQDGPALDHGDIIAPTVGTDVKDPSLFHNSFQDIDKFLAAGGRRGRQEQVLVEGTYYINRLFALVEMKDKTLIDIGTVGVVVSYIGSTSADVSGDDYKHGALVEQGQRGVWAKPLYPGKYALNPYALFVQPVRTTNFQLRWIYGVSGSHNFDANLKEIDVITSDAFEIVIPLSIVVHIAPTDAPYVIQQFEKIERLVEATLDPMVSAWFKDSAQNKTLVELVQKRAEIQKDALAAMQTRFQKYRLSVIEVMIGTPRGKDGDTHIDVVFDQLRQRQVASEKITTYKSQQLAATTEKDLRQAEAVAAQQSSITASMVAIEIAANAGKAEVAKRTQEAEALVVTAKAKAEQVKLEGDAEAYSITQVGAAQANAAKLQVEAYGQDNAIRKVVAELLSTAITNTSQPLVPHVMMGEGKATIPDLLMGLAVANGSIAKAISEVPATETVNN